MTSDRRNSGPASEWVIYDDEGARCLLPFTWLRPASGLLLGAWTNRSRLVRATGCRVREVCSDYLAPLSLDRLTWRQALPHARGRDDAALGSSIWNGETIWVSSRVIPDSRLIGSLLLLARDSVAAAGGEAIAFRPGREMASWIGARIDPSSETNALPTAEESGSADATPRTTIDKEDASGPAPADPHGHLIAELLAGGWPRIEVDAKVLGGLADLIRFQDELLIEDLNALLEESRPAETAGDGHAYRLESVRLGDGCAIDHGAVLDAREGPIVLGPGCHVFPHTWLRGPLLVRENCMLLGGRIGSGTSLGPVCRVRGEVEATVMLGFCNKAHDGFIGHSYMGEWINLGAMTTNSDLKNNYSIFRVEPYGRIESTGSTKVGAFLADHVKTRIGTLLGGGTTVGVGTNLVGEPSVASRWIPDFLWGSDRDAVEYDVDRFMETARIVYGRRKVSWSSDAENALRIVHEATRGARGSFIRRST